MIPTAFWNQINDEGIKKFATIEKLKGCRQHHQLGDAGQEGDAHPEWVMPFRQNTPSRDCGFHPWPMKPLNRVQELKIRPEYQSLYLAGLSVPSATDSRMNATRLYTLKYGQNRQVLSIGRVQTLPYPHRKPPEEIRQLFEPYWYSPPSTATQFTATSSKFTSKEEGERHSAPSLANPSRLQM